MDRKGKKNRPKWTESDKNGKKKKTQKGQKKEEKWTNGTQGDHNCIHGIYGTAVIQPL